MITKATLDAMLERIKGDETVNVYEFVRNMRQRRVLMPCKKPHLIRMWFRSSFQAQYVFIHDALNELITCTCGETANNLRAKVQP